MRVLLTTDTVGGVWTFTEELSRGLLRKGHAVGLVSFGRLPDEAQQAVIEELEAESGGAFFYKASEAPLEWMDANAEAWGRGEPVLAEAARVFRPDVVHASQFCFGRFRVEDREGDDRVPVVVTAHSDVLSWAESCLAVDETSGLEGVARLEADADPGWLGVYCGLVQKGLREADAVVAPTVWMARTLGRLWAFAGPVECVANGRGVRGLPADSEKPGGLQVVTAGRMWDAAKGLDVLAEIDLARAGLTQPVLVAGAQEFGSAEAAASPACAKMLGVLTPQELQRIFRASDVYLAPSRYEPFGLAPVEAALCGCAVVARDIASLREVWGEAALYFDSAGTLERVLRSLVESPALLAGMRAASLERARGYTAERMVDRYLAVYERVLAGRVEQARRAGVGEGVYAA